MTKSHSNGYGRITPTSWRLFRRVMVSRCFFSSFSRSFSLTDCFSSGVSVIMELSLSKFWEWESLLFFFLPFEELVVVDFSFFSSNNVDIINSRELIALIGSSSDVDTIQMQASRPRSFNKRTPSTGCVSIQMQALNRARSFGRCRPTSGFASLKVAGPHGTICAP